MGFCVVVDGKEDQKLELFRPLLYFRGPIILATFLSALVMFLASVFSAPRYEATAALAPATNSDTFSSSLQRLSGVASLAGIGLPRDGSASNFDQFLYLLFSPSLGDWLVKHDGVLQTLFPERWDAASRTWVPPSGFAGQVRASLATMMGEPSWTPPDAYSVAAAISAHLAVSKISRQSSDSETSMVLLTYADTNPERAEHMLQLIIQDSNEILRRRAADRAFIQANYLRDKLSKVTVQEYRDTLQRLLVEQEQTLMLTTGSLPYAATPVSPPLPARLVPKRTVLKVSMAAAIAFSLAYFVAIIAANGWFGVTSGTRQTYSLRRLATASLSIFHVTTQRAGR